MSFSNILFEVGRECAGQIVKWGEQNHPDVSDEFPGEAEINRSLFETYAHAHKRVNDEAAENGTLDWTGILLEEVYEALSESDPAKIREELIQVAAVAATWVDAIDRRN